MENMAANAFAAPADVPENVGAVAVAEDAGAAAGENTNSADAQSSEPAQPSATPEQDVTRTQAFAQRLRERTDATIASVGLRNPYTGELVSTPADMRTLKRMMEAEVNGMDPQAIANESALLDRLGEYQLREQENEITSNPEMAEYYNDYRDEVMAIAEGARADGRDVDLGLALRIVMAQHFDEIRARDAERVRQETIKHYNAQSKASPGSIGGSETPTPIDYSSMSKSDFDAVLQKALRGELSAGR